MIRNKKYKTRIRYRLASANLGNRHRLTVHRTNNHTYAQILDINHQTVVSASTIKQPNSYNCKGAREVGLRIGQLAKDKHIMSVYFDRGDKIYHGRVKEVAEGAREFLEF